MYSPTPKEYEECIGCSSRHFCYANHLFDRKIVKECPCSICLVKAACTTGTRCRLREKYIGRLPLIGDEA